MALARGPVPAADAGGARRPAQLRTGSGRPAHHRRYQTTSLFTGMRDGLGEARIPAPTVVLALLLAVVAFGFVLQVGALWRLGSRPADPLDRIGARALVDLAGASGIDRIDDPGPSEAAAPSG